MPMPKVSVIMPCYNHARFLAESVTSILRQDLAELELIFVDDCSTDNSWAEISRLAKSDRRIRPVRHEQNRGLSRTRNTGLQIAQGELIAFCDSDDVWEASKLSVQAGLLAEQPEFDLVYCDALIINERSEVLGKRFSDLYPLPEQPSGCLFPELVKRNFINIQSVLLRRKCLQIAGLFDEQVELVQDWWYWVRLSRQVRFLYCRDALARYRVHSKSTNVVQRRDYCANRFKVFKRILRDYEDIPRAVKAGILYEMGCDLASLGKRHAARGLFKRSIASGVADLRCAGTLLKAGVRMVVGRREIRQQAG